MRRDDLEGMEAHIRQQQRQHVAHEANMQALQERLEEPIRLQHCQHVAHKASMQVSELCKWPCVLNPLVCALLHALCCGRLTLWISSRITVTKQPHFEALLEFALIALIQAGQAAAKRLLFNRTRSLNNGGPAADTLVTDNITPEWLAGSFDGYGCISVLRDPCGQTYLNLNVTQDKNLAVLMAIKAMCPGTITSKPHRQRWCTSTAIPIVYWAIGKYLLSKSRSWTYCWSTFSKLISLRT